METEEEGKVAAAREKLSGWRAATHRRASVDRGQSRLHDGPELGGGSPGNQEIL